MNAQVFDKVQGRARRSAACCCGWAKVFADLHAANAGVERHVADGCEGCDHVVNMEDVV